MSWLISSRTGSLKGGSKTLASGSTASRHWTKLSSSSLICVPSTLLKHSSRRRGGGGGGGGVGGHCPYIFASSFK